MANPEPIRRSVKREGISTRRSRVRRILNTPLVVGTLVFLAIFVPGVYFWHGYQARQTAEAFLDRADELENDKKWGQAAGHLHLYLELHPEDVDARIRLAKTYDRAAKSRPQKPRAIELYYQALSADMAVADPKRPAADRQRPLRQRLAELLIETGRFASAEMEANILLKADPEDRKAHRALALALYGQHRPGAASQDSKRRAEVGAALKRAYELNLNSADVERALDPADVERTLDSADVELAEALAKVYREEPELLGNEVRGLAEAQRMKLADQCMDKLVAKAVAAAPTDPAGYLARYRYRITYKLPNAKEDLVQALKVAPEDVRVLLAAGDEARRAALVRRSDAGPGGDVPRLCEEARQHYEHVLKNAPAAEPAYQGLGDVYAIQGKPDRAIATWEAGLEKCGKQSILLNARLADMMIQQGQLDRAESALELLDTATARLRQLGYPPAEIPFAGGADVLRGRLLVKRGKNADALSLLRRIAGGPKGSGAERWNAYQAYMLLGGMYAATGQPDRAATAYADAASVEPQLAAPHLAAGGVSMAIDRLDSAIDHYKRAVDLEATPENWLLLAMARYRAQLSLPPGARNWDLFQKAIAQSKNLKAKMLLADPWRIGLLEAEYALVRQNESGQRAAAVKEAIQRVRTAEEEAASSAAGLESVATAYELLEARADADRALDKLEKVAGNTPRAYTVRARILTSRKEYEPARAVLQKGLKGLATLPADMRRPLQLGLVQVSFSQGREEEGWQKLLELQAASPSDPALVRQLLETSLEMGKYSQSEPLEEKLRAIEGTEGPDWRYYRARRLLAQATGAQDARLAEAEKLLAEIRQRRPDWPAVHLLSGLILERRGSAEQAVAAYQEAIRLGEQRLAVYERLILLLYQLERSTEAEGYLTQLRDRSATSAGLSSIEISAAVRLGQFDRALEKARRGAQQRPKDPLAQIWLGQVLSLNNQSKEAEAALRKALELGPADPRTYGALVNFYLRANQRDRARETLEELGKKAKVSPFQRALLLGQGYEAIGDLDKAVASYREAERLDPKSALAQERLAAALVRTKPEEAERALRRALELNPQSATARRMLASLLASRGGQKEWDEGLQLLGKRPDSRGPSEADRRLEAVLLARRGGKENLAKARLVVERLIADAKSPSPADRLLLAQLLEAEGNVAAARKEYAALAGQADPAPAHLGAYVDFLLRQNAPAEAGTWLEKLEKQSPDNALTVGLRVRWLHAQKRTAEIESYLEKVAERLFGQLTKDPQHEPRNEVQFCLTIGDLYSSATLYQAAERWYRRAAKIDPTRYERLALSVAQQGRVKEAITLCAGAAGSDKSSRPAVTLASILVRTQPTAEDFKQADPLLNKAAIDHKDDADLLISLANLRILGNRPEEACQLYRRVLEAQPKHVVALNNLATLLAEQPGKGAEAVQFADRAIELVGPQPGLLDTKATALLYAGKPSEAAAILGDAISSPNPDPRYYLHLAAACDRLGDAGRAREALARAERGQLTRQLLTDGDRRLLAELSKKFR